MKIRSIIVMLVCLGVVAFAANAVASGVNLEEKFRFTVQKVDPLAASLERLSSGLRINGSKDDASGLANDVWIGRYTEEGVLVWEETFDSGNDDRFISAESDEEDNSYIVVLSDAYDGDRITKEPVILKFGPGGDLLEERHIPLLDYSDISISDSALDEDGNLYLWGSAQLIVGRLNLDNILIKAVADYPERNEVFMISSGAGDDVAREIVVDSENNLIAASTYEERETGNIDIVVRKLSRADAAEIWKIQADDSSTESWGDMDIDASGDVYFATNFTNDEGRKKISIRQVLSEGRIAWTWNTGDYEGDQTVEVTDLTPIGEMFFAGTQTGLAGGIVGLLGSGSAAAGAAMATVEEDQVYTTIRAVPAELSALYPGIAAIVGGIDDSGNGSKIIYDEDGVATKVEAAQPPERDLIFLSDGKIVFLAGEEEGEVIEISAFGPKEIQQVELPAGTDVTIDIPDPVISMTFAEVFEAGYVNVEANPEDSLALPSYFELQGFPITRIEVVDAEFDPSIDLTFTYDEDDVPDESKLIVLTSDSDDPGAGWSAPGERVVHEDNNTITVKVDHFSDFAVGSMADNPIGATEALIALVDSMDLAPKFEWRLLKRLNRVVLLLERKPVLYKKRAIFNLKVFKIMCNVQRGHKLTDAQADRLINEADAIIVTLQ